MEFEETKGDASDVELDVSDSTVLTKYRTAADIANRALQGVITQCVPGKQVVQICELGDKLILRQCEGVFKNKEKGIAFPTCVSVNECACNNSPLPGESTTLKAGDSVKIDLGCHVDGYIAVVAHTLVIPAGEPAPITGRAADCLMAAHIASECAQKLMKPGNKSSQLTEMVKLVAESFDVRAVTGVMSHEVKRFVLEGNKAIPMRLEAEQKVEEFEFEENQVYAVDIMLSTGDGKVREQDTRTTVFKRAVDRNYSLKMKASRAVLTEVNKRFPSLPFSLRMLEDERSARMGVVECVTHQLLEPYPVVYERAGEFVAHFKFALVLLPSGTVRITGLPFDPASVRTEKKPSAEVNSVLSMSAKRGGGKKKKKSKSKKGKAAEGGAAAEAADASEAAAE